MAKKTENIPPKPIGERLKDRRLEELKKGLREMARQLDIGPAHLTDIEHGRRSPSEDLLIKIAIAYGVPEVDLRAAFGKPEAEVRQLASESSVAVAKVPKLLRSSRGMTAEQYDRLCKIANEMLSKEGGTKR